MCGLGEQRTGQTLGRNLIPFECSEWKRRLEGSSESLSVLAMEGLCQTITEDHGVVQGLRKTVTGLGDKIRAEISFSLQLGLTHGGESDFLQGHTQGPV